MVVRARLTTAIVFGLHAAVFGSWTPHIPLVKDRIGLNEATLGLALLGAPAGSVLAVAAVGVVLGRWGSRPVVVVTMLGYAVTTPLLGLATTLPQLFGALALMGAFMASLDVAMNAQAVVVEERYARPIMSSFHAVWSAGAAAGTGIGVLALAADIGLATQLAVLGAVLALVAVALPRLLLVETVLGADLRADSPAGPHPSGPVPRDRPRTLWRDPRLWAVGGVMFAALLCEGAAADWASVYLRDSLGAPEELAGMGYATFALAMFVGRAFGDRWVGRYGGPRVVAVLAVIAAIALTAVLVVGAPWFALAGFAAYGLGLSCLVPVCLSAAAARASAAGAPAGPALAAADGAGRVGFLLGPPAIGGLAHLTSLPIGLALLPVLCAAVALAARQLRPAPAP